MRAARIAVVGMLLVSGRVLAQPQPAPNNAPTLNFDYQAPSLRLTLEPKATTDRFFLGKHVKIAGPMVAPLKSKKVWDFPRRFVRLFNPFAKSSESEQPEEVRMVGSRAWSTIVGWNRPFFPDDTHHEPQLGLFSVSFDKEP